MENDDQKISIVDNVIEINGKKINLYSPEGFKLISDLWLKVGWDQKYIYSFSWLGRPIIQAPDDMLRMQEVIYEIKPDVIVETGIAHGGSLIFYASILKCIGKGRIIGIDIDIRQDNRAAIEKHKLFSSISLIEGSSTDNLVLKNLQNLIKDNDKVIVILDSAHDYNHVKKELEIYSNLVSVGSYIVVTDGSQEYLGSTPRAKKDYAGYVDSWKHNNPKKAAEDFVLENDKFKIIEPKFLFNEGNIDFRVTHWPSAFIKKLS
ncbi:cephalosporin hydroxylase family protein [Candidatus Pelagibacter ubique]|jgi:cephalosporin hydroxylase|nr:cephalosporin hydroxylase family protein [Candidatus Pelagibacter ubique]